MKTDGARFLSFGKHDRVRYAVLSWGLAIGLAVQIVGLGSRSVSSGYLPVAAVRWLLLPDRRTADDTPATFLVGMMLIASVCVAIATPFAEIFRARGTPTFRRLHAGAMAVAWISPAFVSTVPLLTIATGALMPFIAILNLRTGFEVESPLGVCSNCGYNFVALRSRRCPECGTPRWPRRHRSAPPAE